MNLIRGYEEIAARLLRSTVQVRSGRGGGSGVVWAPGIVVTNAHVVHGRSPVVIDHEGRRVRASVTKHDAERDLAVLTVKESALEPAGIGDSDSLRPAQIVLAIGSPLGLSSAVSAGIVHANGRIPTGPGGEWIQADVRLAPGNSGGMLADAGGRVVGVNAMIWRGVGLAIPARHVNAFLSGDVTRVTLGVEMIPVADGLMVVRIEPNSVAQISGLLVGDIITCDVYELRRCLESTTDIEIPILRAGRGGSVTLETERAQAA